MTEAGGARPPLRELVSRDQWTLPAATVRLTLRDASNVFVERVRHSNWLLDDLPEEQDALQPLSRRQLVSAYFQPHDPGQGGPAPDERPPGHHAGRG
ncbi:hypothetical protein [Marinobacter halodurans]|uniref:hypothetical protein n=1 Tax=Marinobacter halodurans TaxID=2528979 RepID=UPI0013F176CD|nr:hypothetical protein [Marinobacter halodurans]